MKKMSVLKIKKKEFRTQSFTSSQFFAVLNFNESQRSLFQSDLGMPDNLQ
tara:strand:+ start:1951 stop:2100 length:150 start_codon:yes stop_codon:yes gene_type:complete